MARWTSSKHGIWIAALLTLLALAPVAFAADGDKSSVKGLITAINGDTVTVRDSNNVDHTITLSSTTEIKKKEGLAAVRFERMQKTALMAGLPIVADLVAHGDQLQATAISFRSDDMRTAHGIRRTRHGLHAMLLGERRRVPGTPYPDFLERPDVPQRGEVTLRLHPGAENREHRRILSRQPLRRDRGCRGGPHLGDEPAVHHGERLAGLGLEHHDEGVMRVSADVVGIERDELGAEGASIRGHDGEEAPMGSHREHRAHRLYDLT